jgi:hypothetical protein
MSAHLMSVLSRVGVRSGTCFVTLQSVFLVACLATPAPAVVIGGITFNDNAFADFVADASPSGTGYFAKETSTTVGAQALTLPADFAILQAAVVGADITEWISLRTPEARLTVGFADLIPVNGPGNDVAIIELGATAPISVTIAGTTQQYTSQPSGTANINFVLIDLGDFGVAQAAALTISSTSILNDIAAIGALNSVPEPSTLALAAVGFVALAAWGWRKRSRS